MTPLYKKTTGDDSNKLRDVLSLSMTITTKTKLGQGYAQYNRPELYWFIIKRFTTTYKSHAFDALFLIHHHMGRSKPNIKSRCTTIEELYNQKDLIKLAESI